MMLIKNKILAIFSLFFILTSFASANSGVEFFSSNNTQKINLPEAYARLIGKPQKKLEHSVIKIMQKNHIQQGTFMNILGTYKMSSDQNITADNSERYKTSPKQYLTEEQIFSLAKELAVDLQQESIAVFIPNNQSTVGDISIRFTTQQPTINQIITLIRDRLPAFYSDAFSLHLASPCEKFDNVKVDRVEWIGNKIQLKDIQQAFPQEKIQSQYGKAFLVFQNGEKQPL